ncbi:MAG: DUF5753 domain-containing protein, partial [Streptosporangiaceae bacterium]
MWDKYAEAKRQRLIPSKFRPLTKAELEATQICLFAPILVPGLFQTEMLARLVLSAEQPREKVEGMLAVRMERQSILTKVNPPWVLLLISESTLRNIPPEVREEQCKRLLDLVDETNIAAQLIPLYAQVFQSSGFQLLSFDRGPDVAYIDGAGVHGQMLTDLSDVRGLTVLFSMIRTAALPARESEDLIRTIMEG